MARKNSILIYSITTNYTSCSVWHGSRVFHNRLGTSKLTLNKGQARRTRYEAICKFLVGMGEVAPSYRPTANEK